MLNRNMKNYQQTNLEIMDSIRTNICKEALDSFQILIRIHFWGENFLYKKL